MPPVSTNNIYKSNDLNVKNEEKNDKEVEIIEKVEKTTFDPFGEILSKSKPEKKIKKKNPLQKIFSPQRDLFGEILGNKYKIMFFLEKKNIL